MIYSNYGTRPAKLLEENRGKKWVKTAGYIPLKEQLKNLDDAGKRLVSYRESQFMYANDSLAERDEGMPLDIFQDPLDVMQMQQDFSKYAASKANASSSNEPDEATSEKGAEADSGASEASDNGGAQA